MQSFTLRPADWEDLPAFKHIARTTLTEDIPALFDPNKLLEDKKIGFEYIMAAEQNGEIVGFCRRGACRDEDASSCGEIATIYILKKAQGMGIGRALTEKAISMLSASGYTQCKLWALANNEHAAGFYKKMGFAPDGGETFLQLGSPARCIRFTRALP